MARKHSKLTAPNRLDYRGARWHGMPNAVTESVSFAGLCPYAKTLLYGFTRRFNGYNNGKIGYSSREMIAELGGCHYRKVKDALVQLLDGGFIARGSRHARIERMADEWRITFASSGAPPHVDAATNDYKDRVPPAGKWKQPRVDKASTARAKTVEAASAEWKRRVECASTPRTETPSLLTESSVDGVSAHICNQSLPLSQPVSLRSIPQVRTSAALPLDELRAFTKSCIEQSHEVGIQRRLAERANVPPGTLTKFLQGRNLPERYRVSLQSAVGARLSYTAFVEASGDGGTCAPYSASCSGKLKDAPPRDLGWGPLTGSLGDG